MPVGIKQKCGYFNMTLPDGVQRNNFPFEFIGLLKSTVPSSMRSYNPVTTIWTIENTYHDQIKKLYEQWFGVPNHDLFEQ